MKASLLLVIDIIPLKIDLKHHMNLNLVFHLFIAPELMNVVLRLVLGTVEAVQEVRVEIMNLDPLEILRDYINFGQQLLPGKIVMLKEDMMIEIGITGVVLIIIEEISIILAESGIEMIGVGIMKIIIEVKDTTTVAMMIMIDGHATMMIIIQENVGIIVVHDHVPAPPIDLVRFVFY